MGVAIGAGERDVVEDAPDLVLGLSGGVRRRGDWLKQAARPLRLSFLKDRTAQSGLVPVGVGGRESVELAVSRALVAVQLVEGIGISEVVCRSSS